MAGIELFDQKGEVVELHWNQIISKHSLSSERKDSQTVDKLINRVYLTTDSHHHWLAPFKKDSSITIDMGKSKTLSLIRLWNYNESRIYSTRGVRYISMELDSRTIFQGEVKKASGELYNQ
jgi:hypothetical protein